MREEQENQSIDRVVNFIYIFVVLICVSISTWASHGGLQVSLGPVAYAGAALIGLILFASDLGMSSAKRGNRSIMPALIAFCFALVFSTASNFNHFYTQYFDTEVSRNAFVRNLNIFEENVATAKARMIADPRIAVTEERLQKIEKLLDNFSTQVLDPKNPGVGARARQIQQEINRILPGITTIEPPLTTTPISEQQGFVRRYRSLVINNFQANVPSELSEYSKLRVDMERTLEEYKRLIPTFASPNGVDSQTARDLVEQMMLKSRQYETQVNAIISQPKDYKGQSIDPNFNIGEIVQTFKSVFSAQGDYGVAIWSLILSLFIDLIPLIYAFTLVRPIDEIDKGPLGLRHRRRR